ncbi:class I SAM-dependent methyltransferase [Nocardioides coralli]|uniref:class I SAM-dependent methyltransferase n=1 Tax=Nocardioides coralli TaxID=2872154 RepID=UPI001CA3897C|nr:methyltransferase domain-containing protein [Nocardioides coralli]QZY28990.1 methyltransferase domain-containing protein [Nocardioides coralli]
MSFDVAASAYDRFMGRYAAPLAPLFADLARVEPGQRVLDVGCGPGALTGVLVARLGEAHVAAVDPSPPFVAAARERFPTVDVREGVAESLPFADGEFEAAVAQLVVHFMSDPVRGLAEMARVTAPGGVVAACVWDHGTGRGPLAALTRSASRVADAPRQGHVPGANEGDLGSLFREAGLDAVEETALDITVSHATFEEWWEPYTHGVGPVGDFIRGLSDTQLEAVRQACAEDLGAGPIEISARAWAAVGTVGPG